MNDERAQENQQSSECSLLPTKWKIPFAILVFSFVILLNELGFSANKQKIPGTMAVKQAETKVNSSANAGRNNGLSSSNWMEVRDVLCPDYQPNLKAGSLLFALARRQLNITTAVDNNIQGHSQQQQGSWISTTFFDEMFCRAKIQNNFESYDIATGDDDATTSTTSIVYIPIWKCANNQIRQWIRHTFHESNPPSYLSSESSTKKVPCLVTAIRDPISHFLSGYNEIEYRSVQKHHQNITGSKERFSQFVVHFLSNPSIMKNSDYNHIFSMSKILPELARRNLTLTGYLPSLENLTSTWPAFVQERCLGGGSQQHHPKLPEMHLNGQHESSKDPYGTYQAAKEVWNAQGLVARVLCTLHSMDYACWKDLSGIPPLCEEVYTSEDFSKPILAMIRKEES